jgi:RNA polymerase sigma-70 factor (ECF subfamily)
MLFHRAQEAWPDVRVTEAEFDAWIRAHADGELDEAGAAGLYLTCACARGDKAALRALDRLITQEVEIAVRRMRAADLADEISQRLREKLLLADEDGRARLVDYAGRGSLRAWLRVAAVRLALNHLRDRGRRERKAELELDALPSPARGAESSLLRRLDGQAVRAALEDAFARLEVRERTILRLHFLEGHGIDQLGAFFRVHRATAARWLQAARRRLLDETRGRLVAQLSSETAADGALGQLDAFLDVSVRRLLLAS